MFARRRLRGSFGVALATLIALLGLEVGISSASQVRAAATSNAKAVANAADAAEVLIPNARRVIFTSRVNGHRYAINVALPFESPPPQGYDVLYVLDGDTLFASATEMARGRGNAPRGVVVVGIGYPDDPAYRRSVMTRRGPVSKEYRELPDALNAPYLERVYDLTLPATDSELDAQSVPGFTVQKSQNVGGLDDFLKTLESEIKPRVAKLAPINPKTQAIFGHSLGGTAVLHALFIEPTAFRSFIIASPSIWWNHKEVLADEAQFAEAVRAGRVQSRVLISVGGEEDVIPVLPESAGIDAAAFATFIRETRMVGNARDLVARLMTLRSATGYQVEDLAVFDHQVHSMSAWPALARAIPFALATGP